MPTTPFPLGAYVGNPNGNDAVAEKAFEGRFDAFVQAMGGARPLFMNAFTDFTQDPSAWAANASWSAWSWNQSGPKYAAASTGIVPVVGVPMASNAGGWANVDTFYKQIVAGTYDADYRGIVDSWAQAGFKTIQFRPGYEMDGNFMPWSPGNSSSPTANADFVKAFQHIADLIHSEGASQKVTAQVVWNPADINYSNTSPAALYPGDSYVDIVSTDAYSPLYPNDTSDWSGNGTTQVGTAAFAASAVDRAHFWQYSNASQYNPTPGLTSPGWSMQETIDFAAAHGKPLSISESGSGPSNSTPGPADDPAFATWLAGSLKTAQAKGVVVQNVDVWDDTQGDGDWNFTNGSKPLAEASWGASFGAAATSVPANPTTSTVVPTPSPAPTPVVPAPVQTPGPAPTPIPVPVQPLPVPVQPPVASASVAAGSGHDLIALSVSEDAWQGNAQFTVAVDGKQVGGTMTATAPHAGGSPQIVDLYGDWGYGTHAVSVDFVNDAYGGSASTDRNLYADGVVYDGTASSSPPLALTSNGAGTMAVGTAVPAPTIVGSGADTVELRMSQDYWQGSAHFTVSVDGTQVGGTMTTGASHAAVQDQTFDVMGNWGSGSHSVSVNFLDDAYGGTALTDRNLYVDKASYDGTASGGTLSLLGSGAQSIRVAGTTPAPIVPPVPGPSQDMLDLKMSEDAWQGDAQFTLSVDGTQVGGTMTATASHAAGADQDVVVKGSWGSGTHAVSVAFVNDAYGGSDSMDRNLYVDGISYDGTPSGASAAIYSNGAKTMTVGVPTAAAAPKTDTLVLGLAEDAWQGDAQFTVTMDGKQVGGTFTATTLQSSGQTQTLSLQGAWGSGPHTVGVDFLNDAWGGSASTDRNLYVDSIGYDGSAKSGSGELFVSGTRNFSF